MQSSNIYIEPSRRIRPKIPARLALASRRLRSVGSACDSLHASPNVPRRGFPVSILALLGWGMQNQTAPVAFTTARVPNGPLQKVFEQDGYRWTEGGNGTRHFRRSDCDIVPGRKAVHFVPQRAVLLGAYPGVKADASCVLATCEEPAALEVWVADRAKPDFATAETKFFEEVKRALELRCKAPVFPRHIIAVVDGCLPDGDEMWTGAGGGCVIFARARVHIAAQVGYRPRSRRPRRNRSRRPCGRRGRLSRWPSLSGHEHAASQNQFRCGVFVSWTGPLTGRFMRRSRRSRSRPTATTRSWAAARTCSSRWSRSGSARWARPSRPS